MITDLPLTTESGVSGLSAACAGWGAGSRDWSPEAGTYDPYGCDKCDGAVREHGRSPRRCTHDCHTGGVHRANLEPSGYAQVRILIEVQET